MGPALLTLKTFVNVLNKLLYGKKCSSQHGKRCLCVRATFSVFPHVFDNVGFSCMDYATAQIARLQYSKVPSKG